VTIAGGQPAEPGYRAIKLTPTPGIGQEQAIGAVVTGHGPIACGWHRYTIDVVMPDGLTAELIVRETTTATLAGGS